MENELPEVGFKFTYTRPVQSAEDLVDELNGGKQNGKQNSL